ncbi:MAG: hypothetical protein IJ811_03850 [Clostridia bacterium]|nr:hypothetical protein [Clostridia bacterium]
MIVKKTIFSEPMIELIRLDDVTLLAASDPVMPDPYDDSFWNDSTSG